jgi:hypothetical protein
VDEGRALSCRGREPKILLLVIFYWAVSLSWSKTDSAAEVAKDAAHRLAFEAGRNS